MVPRIERATRVSADRCSAAPLRYIGSPFLVGHETKADQAEQDGAWAAATQRAIEHLEAQLGKGSLCSDCGCLTKGYTCPPRTFRVLRDVSEQPEQAVAMRQGTHPEDIFTWTCRHAYRVSARSLVDILEI